MPAINPIDYLVIGHLTRDRVNGGYATGGTAAFSALMARALGLQPGIITSTAGDVDLSPLDGIPVIDIASDTSTTFENIQTNTGRQQTLLGLAATIGFHHIPDQWKTARIAHLGPVAQEVEPSIIRRLSNPVVGVTPQGWLRTWDANGLVKPNDWPEAAYVLSQATIAIISLEDVGGDEAIIDEFVTSCPVFVVTEANHGSRVYWNGDVRRFKTPQLTAIETTGSGDIYAAAFFFRYWQTRDPWEAGRFATHLATVSTTRSRLAGIPTPEEVHQILVEVI